MKSEIKLDEKVWFEYDDIYIKGHAFRDGEYKDSRELSELVEDSIRISSPSPLFSSLSSLFSSLNGFFSVVINTPNKTIIAADRMRTGPVFYSVVEGELKASDDCGWLLEQVSNPSRSELSEIEYETSRFVTGPHTLYEEISQLQSGEIVVFEKPTASFTRHQHHVHTVPRNQYNYSEIHGEFQRVLNAAFERLVKIADGRPIVIPLTGGYDSQLIALMLKRIGYENVITYTVDLGQDDLLAARHLADSLGYSWIAPNITHSDWEEFYKSDQWNRYFNQASYIGSLPGLVEILALINLRKNDEIPSDALFVPGHSALDSMKSTPKKLKGKDSIELNNLTKLLVDKHYKYNDHLSISHSDFVNRVAESINIGSSFAPKTPVEAFERWRLKERRTKMIINGVRVFDFMGWDWWIPLEDQEIYDFWRKVPIEYKCNRNFYEDYIESLYTDICGERKIENNSSWKKSMSDKYRNAIFWPIIQKLHQIWEKSNLREIYVKHFHLRDLYESDPRFGITSWESLVENYYGQSYVFHSLLTQSVTRNFSMTENYTILH